MQIYYSAEQVKVKNPVITVGTFDGVHLGHRAVISRMKELSHSCGGDTLLFSFSPHPRLILGNSNGLQLLTTATEKAHILEKTGIDHLLIYPFTEAFSKMHYFDFIREILVEKLHICTLVVGYDHRFGHNREGNYDLLKEYAGKFSFSVERLEALNVDMIEISSTKIRHALQKGDVITANRLLGYEYLLHGQVVKGQQMGEKLGFPTANIRPPDAYKLIPGNGVYAVRVAYNEQVYKGMLNIGYRPTVNIGMDNKSIEVHIFRFNEKIYGEELTIEFVARIRDEMKFDSVEKLKIQLESDRQTISAMDF